MNTRQDTGLELRLSLPGWVAEVVAARDGRCAVAADRMALSIELARRNVETGAGGPFGAAVFERGSGRVVAAGVNVVLSSRCSHAHAEMMALALAQQQLGTHDLGAPGLPDQELVTSCEPCAMCFGEIPWSGVRRIVCGAREEDARALGFDEGEKPGDWIGALEERGIEVERDILRDEARAAMRRYREGRAETY